MYRAALIGCGRIAPAHYEAFEGLTARAEIAALCDMNDELRQQRQRETGVETGFASLDALLEWGEFDIGVVMTPPGVRSGVCLPLMEAGKHVFVEKPFTHELDEAQAIVDAADRAGVTLAVSQNFRWMPPIPRMREGILDGRIGRVISATRVDTGWRDETAGWRNTTDYLALSIMGVHWFDQFRWLLGEEATRVYASTHVTGLLSSAGEDITSSVVTFQSGAVASLVHHWASHTHRVTNCLQVGGADGAVVQRGGTLTWFDKDGVRGEEELGRVPVAKTIEHSWHELLDALDEGRRPHHHGRDNLGTMAILAGAYESARTGQSVEIADSVTE
ncbi:MAG: Gfo/Idh/MocA family oxidoreductase [Candidatus Poribacteria bacterium]|jgi:predicted dehydrogenase